MTQPPQMSTVRNPRKHNTRYMFVCFSLFMGDTVELRLELFPHNEKVPGSLPGSGCSRGSPGSPGSPVPPTAQKHANWGSAG